MAHPDARSGPAMFATFGRGVEELAAVTGEA